MANANATAPNDLLALPQSIIDKLPILSIPIKDLKLEISPDPDFTGPATHGHIIKLDSEIFHHHKMCYKYLRTLADQIRCVRELGDKDTSAADDQNEHHAAAFLKGMEDAREKVVEWVRELGKLMSEVRCHAEDCKWWRECGRMLR
ncbi:MAG: hypothetical protein Q9168_005384 [Polycauliona sp. 1 TL-2023]